MTSLSKGRLGESFAADYLVQKGFRIVERNWRFGRGEIDIIAWAPDNTLVFIEVKTRSGEDFGGPEGAVTRKKRQLMMRTAGHYMESIAYEWIIRFDVIAIIMKGEEVLELRHIEDAFFPDPS